MIHLGLFLRGPGHHLAAWRHPGSSSLAGMDFRTQLAVVRAAEESRFDMVFLADGLAVRNFEQGPHITSRMGHGVHLEPLTLLSALAVHTERIGLAATASTSYTAPFHVARQFASLDHLGGGRAAWNLVTSVSVAEARNVGFDEHLPHAERYARAESYVDVVRKLWDSWSDDAFTADKAGGQYFDPQRVFPAGYRDEHFAVEGPLNIARSPQGHPVIVQAGSSAAGQKLAARTADVVFTAQPNLESAIAFRTGLRQQVEKAGRPADALKVLPGLMPVVGDTEEEAQRAFAELQGLIDPEVGMAMLSRLLGGVDLSGLSPDAPLPELGGSNAIQSRLELIRGIARSGRLTIRQTYTAIAGARGHHTVIGTPETVAGVMEQWFRAGGADGFIVLPALYPQHFEKFASQVVPILQERGLFRKEYAGSTLRSHLGIPRKEHFTSIDRQVA
ncbi:LLM class flavin-dependent oxidoreductase [Pseudochelatococcus lubricantis]